MTALALLLGYVVGSLPTADFLGRIWGVDLRHDGSRNPGANNARRLAGMPLAALVLLVEMGKGVAAVALGFWLGDAWGAVAAGVGAIAGNVYNIWYRFEGGKGLGITAGVVLAVWPAVFIPILVVIVGAALLTHSSGKAALTAMVAFNLFALTWIALDLSPGPWGIRLGAGYLALSIGASAVLVRKHLEDALRPAALREIREQE